MENNISYTTALPPGSPPTIFVAGDLGAGNSKIVWGPDKHFSDRSLVHFDEKDNFVVDLHRLPNDVIHYVDGTAIKLKGKYWVVGSKSMRHRNLEPKTASYDPTLKISNALPLLLGLLTNNGVLTPGENNIVLTMSHHDPKALGQQLIDIIEGVHQVVRNKETYNIQIKFPDETKVVTEGSFIGDMEEYATLDIGELTTILTHRANGESYADPERRTNGVGSLIKMLTTDKGVTSQIGGVTASAIGLAEALIEASEYPTDHQFHGKVIYRCQPQGTVDITAAYMDCLKRWVPIAFQPAMDQLNVRKGQEYRVIAIGGGSRLLRIDALLKKKGIDVYDGNPIFANVQSIYDKLLAPLSLAETIAFDPFNDSFDALLQSRQTKRDDLAKRRQTKNTPKSNLKARRTKSKTTVQSKSATEPSDNSDAVNH